MAKKRYNKNSNKKRIPKYIDEIIVEINNQEMLSKMDINELFDIDNIAYKVASYAVDEDIKNAQLRSFFESLKRMERNKEWKYIKPDFILLKPRIAVRVDRKNIPEGFFKVIIAAMDKVEVKDDEEETMKNFKIFVEFFESIIAYHKYLGGKNV